ncbi:MAG: sigma 54-interacting transcriptional regulator [Acidobacteriota bacterium]|jgi:transcriptional regulator with GAF, ATPase, and Fis domain
MAVDPENLSVSDRGGSPSADAGLDSLLDEVYALALDGQVAEGGELLSALLELAPDPGALRDRCRLARVRLAGDPGAAGRLTSLAEGDGPLAWRARLTLARLARREGRAEDAARLLNQAIRDLRTRAADLGAAAEPVSRLVSHEVKQLSTDGPADSGEIDARDLLRLVRLGGKLALEDDPEEVLRIVLHEAAAATGAERGFVVLAEGESLEFAAAEKLDRSEIESPEFEVSRTLINKVRGTGEVELLRVVELPPDHPSGKSLGLLGIRVCVCVPIPGGEGIAGVLYLDARSPDSKLGGAHRKLLELFAAQASAALENARLHREKSRALERAEETIRRHTGESQRAGYDRLLGASDAMQQVYRQLDRIIPTEEPVILLGETGTGKDLAARTIHARGPRGEQSFVPVNCAGLAESLLEAELFGHERGAFTGADRARPGLLELANRGTLFLDEVGDMSPRMQGDLLRALQSGEVRRLGGRQPIRVDVRVIAATHRDLRERVRQGSFREDLYFRLHVLELRMPPLRERSEDIPQLVDELLPRLVKGGKPPRLSGGAMARLMAYSWPGNFRELENVLRRVAVLDAPAIGKRHLPPEIRDAGAGARRPGTLREAEAEAIRRAMRAAEGNKAQAARMLGIDRKTLYARLKALGR